MNYEAELKKALQLDAKKLNDLKWETQSKVDRAEAVSVMMQGRKRYVAEMNGVEILHDEGMLGFAFDALLDCYELRRRK